MLGSMVWWVISANKWFKGPKVNIEHAMLGRVGNVIVGKWDGEEGGSDSGSGLGSLDAAREGKRVEKDGTIV